MLHKLTVANISMYREVQLDSTPEIEVLYLLFEGCHTKNRKGSFKDHIKYFHFRSKVLLDHPVCVCVCVCVFVCATCWSAERSA